ncbi:MAG: PKD domain-containing protein [Ardenticatenaceae bacterium]|nr:PKD domain-containing protein [Ardenticatenaceae bacterium]
MSTPLVSTEPGSYTVTLTVNNDGGTMSVTKVDYITVTLGAPVANFSTTPISGTVPLTVTLTDLSTGQPTSWGWDFGDGGTATVQHPSHTYSAAGTYTVTLTVSNTVGSDTATGTVTVLNSVADTAKVVRRISYRFGGQVVATRVVAEDAQGQLIDNPAFTGLFYVHGDHLGSATALSYGQDRPTLQGTLVPDSVARFLPFGGYRGAKPQTNPAVSDRGFTGHKHNDDLGLVYMNARYYVPGIGRFASADTIIPDPMNPQGFNRYSYVENNPVRNIDLDGHQSSESCYPNCYVPTPTPVTPTPVVPVTQPSPSVTPTPVVSNTPTNTPTSTPTPTPYQLQYEKANPSTNHMPMSRAFSGLLTDATLIGFSGSAVGGIPFTPLQGVGIIGIEVLINLDELPSVFVYGGGGLGRGMASGVSLDAGPTAGLVWNLDEHANYSGPFATTSADASALIGFQINGFGAPSGDTWGLSASPVAGAGLSISHTRTTYYEVTWEDVGYFADLLRNTINLGSGSDISHR